MRAWERAGNLFWNAQPVIRSEEEQTWTDNIDVSGFYDQQLSLDWASNVPGSGAPEKIMVAAFQALENRGYIMSDEAYGLLEDGLKAHAEGDYVTLHKISALLRYEWRHAKKDISSPYWKYKMYTTFEQYEAAVNFPEAVEVDTTSGEFRDKIRASWMSQMIGGAMGTMVEGYTSQNLYKAFGEVRTFLREPNTFNDDVTFELAFLYTFLEKGYDITSKDIALNWAGLIPCGWSAEEIAIRNIKAGVFPPQSAQRGNPFSEWIGAQMKAGICGMVAPGNPRLAAKLAWADGEVAHANNGILGEVFNAVMTSLAFVRTDIRDILETAVSMIPCDSEYSDVVNYALERCQYCEDWHDALADCMERYKRYNWIHAYPNACCEVIALWYGYGDYEETLHIVTMCGVDVDCNAAMIMPLIGIMKGMRIIPDSLHHEAFNALETYMRAYREISLDKLVEDTLTGINNAKK